jgi:hypothetical protein
MDCSNCLPSDVLGIIDECARVVQSQPRKSVRTLIIAGGGRFELETISRLKNLAKDNEPFVLKSAVVGITGLQQVVIMTVSKFSKREFNLFDTVEEAKDFLVAD